MKSQDAVKKMDKLMNHHGWTITEATRMIGLSDTAYHNWKSGLAKSVRPSTAKAINDLMSSMKNKAMTHDELIAEIYGSKNNFSFKGHLPEVEIIGEHKIIVVKNIDQFMKNNPDWDVLKR